MKMNLTHGSISTGLGGFDIGAEENGIVTKWTCEIDPLRRDILQWRFPHTKTHYTDVRKLRKPPYVDIISFGFPCQDISTSNPYGKGIDGKRSGLWWKGWHIIRKLGPSIIILENSPNLIHKGLRTILWEFANAGYDAEWDIISCKRFGLPHLRKRLFVVAYSQKIRLHSMQNVNTSNSKHVRKESQAIPGNKTRLEKNHFDGSVGMASVEDWSLSYSEFQRLDDGIPKNILYGLLAAAGDTVSPRITSWLFSRIKKALEEKEENSLTVDCGLSPIHSS